MYLYIAAKKYGRMMNTNISKNENILGYKTGRRGTELYIQREKGIISNFQL